MGTPLPVSPVGQPCSACFGVDKKFPTEETPLYVTLRFLNLLPGPRWVPAVQQFADQEYRLTQQVLPCDYEFVGDDVSVFYSLRSGNFSLVQMTINVLGDGFNSILVVPCFKMFAGQSLPDASAFFFGGSCEVEFV